jgi:hypothetical protein
MLDLDGAAAQELFEGFVEFSDQSAQDNAKAHRIQLRSWLRKVWGRIAAKLPGTRGRKQASLNVSTGDRVRRVEVLVRS